MKWFLEYNLGWRGPTNTKAEKGTVVHKVLEVLAIIKKMQQNGRKRFDDDIAGRINVDNYDLDAIIHDCNQFYKKHSDNTWNPTGLDERH